MTQFMYCIPGVKVTGDTNIKELFSKSGIEYAFKEGSQYQTTPVNNSPAERDAVLFQADGEFATCQYLPDNQIWARIEGTDCYVGMWKKDKFTPKDFEREDQIYGYTLKMRDGHEWNIPVAKFNLEKENSGCLRHRLAIDKNGKLVKGELPKRHARLSEIADDLMDKVLNNTGQLEAEYGENYPFDILSGNYRIWKSEVALLQLWYFEDDYERQIIQCFIDVPGFAELKKKELGV